jgi:hypothetical protein
MSKRQMYPEEPEHSDIGEDCCFSDEDDDFSDDSSSDGYNPEDDKIREEIARKRKEEEQRKKDKKQLQDFDVDMKVYSWETPKNTQNTEKEGFPGLLEHVCSSSTKFSENKKGGGFLKYMPEIFFGPTGMSVKRVMCSYFIKGQCTRPNCAFYHPENVKCKYDTNCKNQKCVFVHSHRDDNTQGVKPTSENKNTTERPQNGEKCKHRICIITLQIVNGKVVPTGKTCKHGDNCNFAHSLNEVKKAITENQERFKCKFGLKCKHVKSETYEKVVNDKPIKCIIYKNTDKFCGCPRNHPKESLNNYIGRVSEGRRPTPPKIM